jgi:hypothetical protein
MTPQSTISQHLSIHSKDSKLTNSKHLRRQPNSIEDTLMCIPATITNITTINCQAAPLGPRSIRLAAPVHAVGIIISGLHLLLFVHLKTLSGSHLSIENFVSGLTDSAEGRLSDGEGGKTGCGRLTLDVVAGVRLIGVGGLGNGWRVHNGGRMDDLC